MRSARVGGRGVLVASAVLMAVSAVPAGAGPEAAGASPVGPPAPGMAAGPADMLPPDETWTVTLLTGDVIDVRSDAEGRVTAAARERTGAFRTLRMPDGELYVLPLSLTPLLERVLDLELFNVTGLVRQGYDDDSIDVVPLIVQRGPGVDVPSTLGAVEGEPLASIGAVATEVRKADAEATGRLLAALGAPAGARAEAAGGITKIWLDRQVTILSTDRVVSPDRRESAGRPAQAATELDANLTRVGADRAWAAGFTGAGVTVAVLDTGIDAHHPDLVGKVVAEQNFSSSEDAVDRFGHGTHVASLIAGSGGAAGGARSGVAPGARLISGKVVDDLGYGYESEAIAGMEWAAPQADVVNMSLGYGLDSDGSDPISLAVDTLTDQHETLFVVAAGNSGPLSRTVEFPGAADRALTVGAVDSSDVLADFSSRGPLAGSYELKPEVVAPGVDIVAARAAGTAMGEPVGDLYTRASGTSMATPHAAGAAALLAQRHPDWTGDQLKNGVVASADPIGGDGYDVGGGRIDIGDGVAADLRAERDVVDVSLAHRRTEPHVETLAWTNTGDAPQTVAFEVQLADRQGQPIDGATVEPAELTLDPGATGSAIVTVDGPDLGTGFYSGTVTADPAGDETEQDDLRTPIGVHAAPETVDLTIEATAPRGTTGAPFAFAAVVNLDDFAELGHQLLFFEDRVTVQVPAGRYSVLGDVSSPDPDTQVVAQVGDPDVAIAEATTVAFDGAGASPFHPTVTGVETAPPMYSSAGLVTVPRAGTGGFGLATEVYAWHPMPPIRLTPMEADPEVFAAYQIFRLQAPHLTAEVGGEPIEITSALGARRAAEGETVVTAVDVGDGSDLSPARNELAVVRLPADPVDRAAVTRRAVEAGVAMIAFVDSQRPHLTLDASLEPWADVATVVAAGASAERLQAAASAGEEVTVTVEPSPYVYDIVTPFREAVEPEPVLDRTWQSGLASLRERFHRDDDGRGAVFDRRYPISVSLMNLDSEGPLPGRRTAYVSPGVTWQSIVIGPGFIRFFDEMWPSDAVALAMDAGRRYEPGSRTRLTWLRRPMWPGPVGGPRGASFCQPTPVLRTPTTLQVWLAPFQDGRDRFGCADPHEASLTLERDGTVIGTADAHFAEFDVPEDPGAYRLSYQQTGQGPYHHRSMTSWTFRSARPAGSAVGRQQVPLLVVDYELPLDTLNRPSGRTATLVAHQVTGSEQQAIRSLQVWTSTDGGTTWRSTPARRSGEGTYQVTLPSADAGVAVSLRVAASDADGNSIDQTLYDAYVG
ncbi:MAG TPA: S8 family serine peptidase [Acidimicrobiales bacterium]